MSKDSNAHVLDDAWVLQVTEAKGFGKGMSKAQKIAIAPAVVSAIVRSASKRAKRIDAHAPLSDPLTAHVIGETTLGEMIKDFAKDAGITLSPGTSKTLICADCSAEVVRDGTTQKRCPLCAKAKTRAKMKAYQRSPEAIANLNAHRRTPEWKAKMRVYSKARMSAPEAKAKMRAYRSKPEAKAKAKAKAKARMSTPEAKANKTAWRTTWQRTPESKAKAKAWRLKPEAKARKRARESTPEAKAKTSAYMKARRVAKKKALVDTKEAKATSKGGA